MYLIKELSLNLHDFELESILSCIMRKPVFFAYGKTKAQISCVVDIVQSFYFLNPKCHAYTCSCTAWFVSDLVINPEDRFSRYTCDSFTFVMILVVGKHVFGVPDQF